jgi:hypothetical protein
MKKFKIHYKCISELDVNSLWPDGDAPDNPTTSDVRQLIIECGGIYDVLSDWNLHTFDGDWFVEEIND